MTKCRDTSVSVLMPAYRSAETIRLSVVSTLRALPKSGQLLVGFDGEDLESLEKLSQISDQRLRIHTFQKSGVAGTLNQLASLSDGEWLARMDADDVCLPWRFKHQFSTIKKHGGELLFSNALFLGMGKLYTQLPLIGNGKLLRRLAQGNVLIHPTAVMSRALFEEVGPYENVAAEDYHLWLRAALAGKRICRTSVPVIVYRIHGNQLTKNHTWSEQNKNDSELEMLKRRLFLSLDSDHN